MTYPDRWEPQPDTEQKEDLRAFYERYRAERRRMAEGYLKFLLKVLGLAILLVAGWLAL